VAKALSAPQRAAGNAEVPGYDPHYSCYVEDFVMSTGRLC